MKKPIIITIIVVAIAIIIIIATLLIMSNIFNKEKTPISASDFYTIMNQKGYNVQEAKNQVLEYDYIKQVYIAISEDYSYQIEFYEMTDDISAVNFYNNNKAIFESSKGDISTGTNVDFNNYSEYTLSSNGKYKVISRVGNTVIYINADDNYKDNVKAILNEIGY